MFEAPDDLEAINRLYRERRWSDGLPIVPPTVERVERMLRAHAPRAATRSWRSVAPGFGAATVERIAINAVMAGCEPDYLPVLIAAVEAVAEPQFNLQGIQATTNPVAVWVIVNGPAAQQLGVNATFNCLGQGTWANATIGRALRLVLQNIGGALPGEMDRATHGQPGKYHVLLRRERGGEPVGAAARRARLRARREHGDGGRRRRHDEHEHPHQGRRRAAARRSPRR